MLKLDIRNLLTGPPNRLRYTFRYSTCRIAHPESVAEHSYFVCLYSLAIADWLNYNRATPGRSYSPVMVDKGLLLEKAALHDLEECISGDFPRPFKYSDPQTKSTLDHMAEIAFRQVVASIFSYDNPQPYSTSVGAEWKSSWHNSKDETVEGRIVNVADFLCVLGFMNDEADAIRLQHVHVLEGYYRLFQKGEFDFLRQILDQAGELLKEISRGKERNREAEKGKDGTNSKSVEAAGGSGHHNLDNRRPADSAAAGNQGLGQWREGAAPCDQAGKGEAVRQPSSQYENAGLPGYRTD